MRQAATIFLHPSQLLNANSLPHWAKKAEKVRVLRFYGRHQLGATLQPIKVRSLVTYTFGFLTRTLRDGANYQPSTKALTDGLTDAGVWPSDDQTWVQGPLVEIGPLSPEVDNWPKHMRRVQVTVAITDAGEVGP